MNLIITNDYNNKILIDTQIDISLHSCYIIDTLDLNIIEVFYILNKDLYITDINIEYIHYKTRKYKYMNIQVELNRIEDDRINKYKEYEIKLNKKVNNKGIDISFGSDVYKSIYTSLYKPSLYYSKNTVTSRLFQYINKQVEVTQKDIILFDKEAEKSISDLLYTKVIIKKGGKYIINKCLY